MRLKVFIVLAIVAICFETVRSDSVEEQTNYDSYRTIVNGLSSFAHKIRVLQAVWSETMQKHPTDINKSHDLYKEVSTVIKSKDNASARERQDAQKLQHEVAKHVFNQSTHHVAKILNMPQYPAKEDIYYLVLPFLENTLRVSIYEAAIDKIYDTAEPQKLAAQFEYLREHVPLASAEDLLRAQLYLYWKTIERERNNNAYLFNVAYYFLQIKSSSEFVHLPTDTKLALEKAISELPAPLRYLYFEHKFCLLNQAYPEFIYTTVSTPIDAKNEFVFTWANRSPVENAGEWVKTITKLDDGDVPQLQLEFLLKSKKFQKYMYRANVGNYNNIIASYTDGTLPPNSTFTVKYRDNLFTFRQNGFIMCTKNELYKESRRFVYTYEDVEHSSSTKACQWTACECS